MGTASRGVSLAACVGALVACAHVPPEAVQLSYQLGQDLESLYASYDEMIHDRFEELRARRTAYVDQEWARVYLAKFIEKGRLVEMAQGAVVLDVGHTRFVPPTAGREKLELLDSVAAWSRSAVRGIERKRAELVAPLDDQERAVRRDLREAFGRLLHANAYVSAHLASASGVQQQQDELLQRLGIKELRDRIDGQLVKASEDAAAALQRIRAGDELVDEITEEAQLLDKLR